MIDPTVTQGAMLAIGEIIGAALIGGALGLAGTQHSAKIQKQNSREAREWQENMLKSRYQWTMRDMRDAGLNPMLAYKQGAGGVSSPIQAPMPAGGQAMAQGAQAGIAAAKAGPETALARERTSAATQQANLYSAQTNASETQAELNTQNAEKAKVDKAYREHEITLLDARTQKELAGLPHAEQMADFWSGQIWDDFSKTDAINLFVKAAPYILGGVGGRMILNRFLQKISAKGATSAASGRRGRQGVRQILETIKPQNPSQLQPTRLRRPQRAPGAGNPFK